MLQTGITWEDLPAELLGVSGVTCWRRLSQWRKAGVFAQHHEKLLAELGMCGRIDWSRATLALGSIRAKKRGLKLGRSPHRVK